VAGREGRETEEFGGEQAMTRRRNGVLFAVGCINGAIVLAGFVEAGCSTTTVIVEGMN
jgi:hypothetical protein